MLQVDKQPLIQKALPTVPLVLIDIIAQFANETQGGLYGPDVWKRWKNIDILETVPPAPSVDLRGSILLYIPLRISIDGGKEEILTLTVLKRICPCSFSYFSRDVEEQFGETEAFGWVKLDKAVIEESRNKDAIVQKGMVEAKGCNMQRVMESIALNLIVFDFTGIQLYGCKPWTYNRCNEKVDGLYPVFVGGFSSAGLIVVHYNTFLDHDYSFGVACALRSITATRNPSALVERKKAGVKKMSV